MYLANHIVDVRARGHVVNKKTENHRRDQRIAAAVPVEVGSARGVTRDISASGVFLETSEAYAIGSPIDIALDMVMPWGKTVIRCTGRVVRIERSKNRLGVAVALADSPAGFKSLPKSKPKPKVKAKSAKARAATKK